MRTDDTTNAETEITQIAAFGDTTLIVGPDKKKLMVQSSFLRGASEFLNNLLEFFIEAATGPIVVPFPEEDARSVEIICNVLHHCNDAVPRVLTPSEVLAVAITALSLDCIVALTWASVAWLRATDLNDLRGLSQLMAAAYILDNSQAFGDITLAMMLHHNDPYYGLPHPNLRLNNHFSWIMHLLQQKRADLRRQLDKIMLHDLRDASDRGPKHVCYFARRKASSYAKQFEEASLWPVQEPQMTINEVFQKLEEMNDLPGEEPWRHYCHLCTSSGLKQTHLERLKEFSKDCHGLCLDCIRRDVGDSDRICQVAHK